MSVASKGYSKFHLTDDEDIEIKIGKGYQAFIYGSNTFFQQSTIRIIDGKKYKDIDSDLLVSTKGVAILGDTVTIYFTKGNICDVEIWVISEKMCMDHAFLIENTGTYNLQINPNEFYQHTCIFSFGNSLSDSIEYGYLNENGKSTFFNQWDSEICNNKCEKYKPSQYYIRFENSRTDFFIKSRGIDNYPKCNQKMFAYMNITSLAFPKFRNPKINLKCLYESNEKNDFFFEKSSNKEIFNEKSSNKEIFNEKSIFQKLKSFLIIILIILIIIFLIKSICSCNNNNNNERRNNYNNREYHNIHHEFIPPTRTFIHETHFIPEPNRNIYNDKLRQKEEELKKKKMN